METSANYVGVGAFVLVCVIGLVVAIMWLAGVQYSQEYAYYRAYFKGPVTGLGTGTITRFNGIEVGRIKSLAFDPTDPQRVIVTMQVQPDLNIREDSVASIESQGLTGGTYVEISGGTVKHAYLGVVGTDVDGTVSDLFRLPVDHGVLVDEVSKGSPAEKAGIKGGDRRVIIDGQNYTLGGDVIVSIDGKDMKSMRDVADYINQQQPGDSVTVTWYHGSSKQQKSIKLGTRPDQLTGTTDAGGSQPQQ